jgi:hypothetical protein
MFCKVLCEIKNKCKKEWHVATKPLKKVYKTAKITLKSEPLFLEKTTVPE